MIEQWQELKETIIELRDNDGTGTQQEVCKFLANLMNVLEKQMQEPKTDVLDKIRTEIEKAVWEDVLVCFDGTDEIRIPRLDPDDVFEIIDKYKAESEDRNE